MFFLPADAKPKVLMKWIVPNNIVWPNIMSLGYVSVLIEQRDVITVSWRGRRMDWGRIWRCTSDEAGKADEADKDYSSIAEHTTPPWFMSSSSASNGRKAQPSIPNVGPQEFATRKAS